MLSRVKQIRKFVCSSKALGNFRTLHQTSLRSPGPCQPRIISRLLVGYFLGYIPSRTSHIPKETPRLQHSTMRFRKDTQASLILKDGVSALDVAKDAHSSQQALKDSVKHEQSTYHGYKCSWSVLNAAKEGNVAVLRRLIDAGASSQPETDIFEDGNSILMAASREGHHDVVRYMLNLDAERIARDGFSSEALESAVRAGRHDEVSRLVGAEGYVTVARGNKDQGECKSKSYMQDEC